GVIWHNNSVLF
nr:immunoglobulin light chain junction region [Macaca mulatta]